MHKERTYRLPDLDLNLVTNPMSALEKYLYEYSKEDKNILLEKAKELIGKL